MRCPRCEFEDRKGIRFCEQCGAKLSVACPPLRDLGAAGREILWG